MILFLTIVIPFLGDNGHNLVKYAYTSAENKCQVNFIYYMTPLTTLGIILTPVSVVFYLMVIFFLKQHYINYSMGLLHKKNLFIFSGILLTHMICYIVGNIVVNYYTDPVTFTEIECVSFNQIQIERHDWLTPVNISLVTWTIPFMAITFGTLATLIVIWVCILIVVGFFSLGKCLFKCCIKAKEHGVCSACCPCCIHERLVINDINLPKVI